MPQITVNEIDQSVVTRVVTDDKVKILCPIIASFGPVYDETQESIKTFTDVTDFNRSFGYTYAEFNPFQDDHSRMYARELIKKGAAVSVVRVNNGLTSNLNIEGSADRQTSAASFGTVCRAAMNSNELMEQTEDGTCDALVSNNLTKTNIVPGTVKLVLNIGGHTTYETSDPNKDGKFYVLRATQTTPDLAAELNYETGDLTIHSSAQASFAFTSATFKYFKSSVDWKKYTFAPQISQIVAKYPGSFGNDIAISIAQVNTTRVAESYQYASISVYYIDRIVNYVKDDNGVTITKQSVKSVTLLENKLVSTNPEAPNYFEDVDFEFIKIIASPGARQELGIVWSNINADPTSASRYSGFPVIPLKYNIIGAKIQTFNFDAFLDNGSDFMYSTETLAKLRSGFKGYWVGDSWNVTDVNRYLEEVYGNETNVGIIPSTFSILSSLYDGYTDPYIYDFDFITSSGFTYAEYDLGYVETTEELTLTTGTAYGSDKGADLRYCAVRGTETEPTVFVTVTLKSDGSTVTYQDKGDGKLYSISGGTSTEVGTVTYGTPTETNPTKFITIKAATAETIENSIVVRYDNASTPKIATPSIPHSVSVDGKNTCYYTEITPIHQSMLNLVNTRQDCIALFDVPADYDPQQIVDYSYILNTSYGTIHNPWCYVNSPDIAGQEILMAPSYIFLYTFLSNLINNVESQKWFPPAGVERATARVVTRPYYEIGSVILNDWQNDNISRVNPIMKLKQYGYVIYGQYTTLPAIDLYTHSALESLNVRLISNVVKKKIFDTCLNLAFEPNTSALWLKFFAQLDPFLRYMKYNDGLYDYRIVMDESTVTTDDINHLRCPGKVYIAPTRTAEFFDIDFIITDAGAVFSD